MRVEGNIRPDLELPDGFKPIKDFGYNGRFPAVMEVNEKAIKEVFELAGLGYSGIVIESMSQSDIDISKGRKNLLFTTDRVNNRWRIQINDEEMIARLEKKGSRDDYRKRFIPQFNGLIKDAVLECIRKEKLSNRQDSDLPLFGLPPEAYDITMCWFFLHPVSGITLVKGSS